MIDLEMAFTDHDDEYCKFDRVPHHLRLSERRDLCAMMLLDHLVPGSGDIVAAAEHDEFFIDIDVKALAEAATEEHVINLIRMGVCYHESYESLYFNA